MLHQVLPIPAELRVIIYDHVKTDEIVLPGPLPAGVAALLATSKQTRSEVLARVWGNTQVIWQGSFTSTTWRKFQKIAIPRIRRLTIVVDNHARFSRCLDSDFHLLLKWMCRRGKPGLKARYPWALEDLTLTSPPSGRPSNRTTWWCQVHRRWCVLGSDQPCRDPGCKLECPTWKLELHELDEMVVEKIRRCGVKVRSCGPQFPL